MLIGNNISKAISGKNILSDIDIVISPREITSLIGPSGGGKSTLLKTLSMLERPDSGTIVIDERRFDFPMKEKSMPANIYPSVSVVFQQFHLWPHLSILENIIMPLRRQGIIIDQDHLDYLINYFEIDGLAKRYPHQISVGQKQRVAFIRAVMLNPKYLLLDEITSALDIHHIGNILGFLKRLANKGTGILIATHLIGFAANVSDKIVFLNKGVVIESGTKEILKLPKTELFTQFLKYLEYAG